MILKGNQRGNGRQLAVHLLNTRDNEHVQVHEVRGFMSDDLESAFHEAYAVSRGTKAKQFLFSLSLSPPAKERVSTETFETTINNIEKKLGLEGQPRAIVFHEKEGRRHAHAVWSRIDTEEMKAINLPHYKLKLRDVARELYLEKGWQMPRGFANSKERDPTNFSLAEWQQAKRTGQDPKALKQMFQECWAISDSRAAFAQALQARGYHLAKGDRRGFVAVDHRGEVYAISKYVGIKTKQVRERLGDSDGLDSVEKTKETIATRMQGMLERHAQQAEKQKEVQSASFAFRKAEAVQRQRDERSRLEQAQQARWTRENQARSDRMATGLRGLWQKMTGKQAEIRRQNELEALQALQRDRAEKDALIWRHIQERQRQNEQLRQMQDLQKQKAAELQRDIATYKEMATPKEVPRAPERPAPQREQTSLEELRSARQTRSPGRTRDMDRDR